MKKSLSRIDVFFFLVCTLVGLDTLGSVAAKGAEGFFWLIVLAAVFFVPYALLTSELGAAFPEQGGSYWWTKHAFGPKVAAINAVFYWFSNPIWLGGALTTTALTTFETFWFPLGPVARIVFGLGLVWGTVLVSMLSLRAGKWVTTGGAWARVLILAGFTLTVVLYARHHGVHGIRAHELVPSYDGFLGLLPLLFFNFVGFELPSAAGGEMQDPRKDVPHAVIRAAVASVLCYGVPILAILVVVPTAKITGLKGFIDAMQLVFTVWGGHVEADGTVVLEGAGRVLGMISAVGFVLALVTSGASWIMGADRSQAIACRDGGGPAFLGFFSKEQGTPVALNIASGVVATVVMFGAFAVSGGSAEKLFAASLNLGIATTSISYLGIFPALWILRKKRPEVARPYAVPGGDRGALLVSVLTTGTALLAVVSLVWPGFGRPDADAALPAGFVTLDASGKIVSSERLLFELTQVIPLALVVAVGVGFWRLGQRHRRPVVRRVEPARGSRPPSIWPTAAGAGVLLLVLASASPARAQPDENELTATPLPAAAHAAIPISADKAPRPAPKPPVGVGLTLANSYIMRGTKESTMLNVAIGSYDVNRWVSVFGRVGMVHNTSNDTATATGIGNPVVGATFNFVSRPHLKIGGIAGASIPVGSGGGNAPSAGMLRAWTNSIDWGGVMFAVDHFDMQTGFNTTFVGGAFALRFESTLHQLLRVRGAKADVLGANATVTSSTATLSFAPVSRLTFSGAFSETRFWNTPKAIQESPRSRVDYYGIGAIATSFDVGRVACAPSLSYARALDLPLRDAKFQVVELDLGFTL